MVADTLSRLLLLSSSSKNQNEKNTISNREPFQLFEAIHNASVGHHGVNRTIQMARNQGIQWPNYVRDIRKFIKQCPICQKSSHRYHR